MWRLVCVTLIVFLTRTAVIADSEEPIYKAVGDKVVLKPSPSVIDPTDPITSVMWKHGRDIAAEWYGGEAFSYRHFKGRCSLNSSTGALTIAGLTRNDSGSYTAEINNRGTNATQLQVISPVSKPTVSTWCDAAMTYCVFTCEGNATEAEPISYIWGASDLLWYPSPNTYRITKEEKERSFYCMLDNPVSSRSSEFVPNPFFRRKPNWPLILLILLAACILLVCVIFITHKCKEEDVEGTPQENAEMMPNGQPAVD
ncbi:lymphocyte function-associated antigen 3-like isoform X2 [Plectropomus leopardus]|uniref:lymphocyte function-associated antigen 3-like isoform X2 n=1 Tax=Plectropomus leopardus TaxID=160734 RepID=UPI001C4B13D6|nr:lymphocyte function-associated antigen 3-like isoform X2 [Plectropomus leopardus]